MKNKFLYVQLAILAVLFAFAAGCNKANNARSDQQVASDVQARINSDANLPNKTITVNANNGTVTLTGSVATEAEKMTAANDASSVDGVKQVVNNLTVAPTTSGLGDNPPPSGASSAPAASAPARGTQRATTTRGTAPSGADRAAVAPGGSSASAPARSTAAPTLTVAQGTDISVRLIDTIDSEKDENGQTFKATVDQPIYVGDKVAIPSGADVEGRIVDVKSAGKFKGRSELTLELTRVSYLGHSYNLDTTTVQKYGASRGKNTAAKVGGGAAAGAIIGGIIGGGKGAAIGAGAGAAAGTGAQAITKGEQIVLKPETLLSFSLKTPVNVAPAGTQHVR